MENIIRGLMALLILILGFLIYGQVSHLDYAMEAFDKNSFFLNSKFHIPEYVAQLIVHPYLLGGIEIMIVLMLLIGFKKARWMLAGAFFALLLACYRSFFHIAGTLGVEVLDDAGAYFGLHVTTIMCSLLLVILYRHIHSVKEF